MAFEFEKTLTVTETGIPGLKLVELPVHGDSRGWFKENWQREKMVAAGIPDFRAVQNNISFNDCRGATRGIHAEPWNKFISVATGSVFGAWVDLRPGEGFGKVFTCELDPSRAIFVPRGVGNSYQALEDNTSYTYLVDAHWSAELKKTYTFVNLADPDLGINWPIPLSQCELSEADKNHPALKDVIPMAPKRTLVTGCKGQLGRAVYAKVEKLGLLDSFDFCDIDTFDMSDQQAYDAWDWACYGTIINCGAYTAVDKAETRDGRIVAWKANATGPALLAQVCSDNGITLVHVSSDYVFDGVQELHDENEPLSPLGVYGQTKAAGDLAVQGCPNHYILRSSWVIGDGANFVKTMKGLSDRCANPDDALEKITVVHDQKGRLTFTSEMASAIFWLLGYRDSACDPGNPAPFGTYNLTGSGRIASWAEIAQLVFEQANQNGSCVEFVSTDEYYASAEGPISPRPENSALNLDKISQTGFNPRDWESDLIQYLKSL